MSEFDWPELAPSKVLSDEQRQRIAAMHAVRDLLGIQVDSVDLPAIAHWVCTGRALPIPEEQLNRVQWSLGQSSATTVGH
jgi:hypothetical protein